MNKVNTEIFAKVALVPIPKNHTNEHGYIRDQILAPIFSELREHGFDVLSPGKYNGTVYQITGLARCERLARTEMLEVRLCDDATITMNRYIPAQSRRQPIETITVPLETEKSEERFGNLCRTLCEELKRFYNDHGVMMTHIVFHHDPLKKYSDMINSRKLRP